MCSSDLSMTYMEFVRVRNFPYVRAAVMLSPQKTTVSPSRNTTNPELSVSNEKRLDQDGRGVLVVGVRRSLVSGWKNVTRSESRKTSGMNSDEFNDR